ncbi:hypothetical protein QO010_003983 [Caulobacter ginsengisoli]|uniref:Uncharacterized protein n=1 Tax=Caulobacter ginsengisoli TaxID=400775 RepID=A0ABU0IW06_9CAUL|nr:hypothetical protein [Caulobacter ginsengisoli]MDQ0466190.1 hypothetical protein [Caulobacter ginsengisoli]
MRISAILAGGLIALLALVAQPGFAVAQTDPDEDQVAQPDLPQQPMPWAPSRRSMPIPPQRLTVRDRAVTLDELGVTPEGPLSPVALGYDARVRASSDAAEGLQGPLDGGWIVTGPDGRGLVVLQLVDPGDGSGRLEGAWRDLTTPDGVEPVGLIDSLDRGAGDLVIRFQPRGAGGVVLQIRPDAKGDWSGELFDKGQSIPVTMRRN